jgi:hypothetical protein
VFEASLYNIISSRLASDAYGDPASKERSKQASKQTKKPKLQVVIMVNPLYPRKKGQDNGIEPAHAEF